ncbi:AAA family ATPase [Rhodococcus koreensis]
MINQLLTALGRKADEYTTLGIETLGQQDSFRAEHLRTTELIARVDILATAGHNLWVTLNPTDGTGRKTVNVTRVVAVHADLDEKNGDLDTLRAIVTDLSGLLGAQPTIVIRSGHGLQPVWVLEGPITLTDSNIRRETVRFVRRWGVLVERVAAIRGVNVDTVTDLPRLIRAPGTTNTKNGLPPVRTGIDAHSGEVVSTDRIREVLDAHDIPDAITGDPDVEPVSNADADAFHRAHENLGTREDPCTTGLLRMFDPTHGNRHWSMMAALNRATEEIRAGLVSSDVLGDLFTAWANAVDDRTRHSEFHAMTRHAIAKAQGKTDDQLEDIRNTAEDNTQTGAERNAGLEKLVPPTTVPNDVSETTLLGGMRDGTWLDAQDFPELEWSVEGIVPEGFGLLCAPPKAGKSWMVGGIGLACACGGVAFGKIPVRQRPVLYLALEDGHRRLQNRFRILMYGERIPRGIEVIIKAASAEIVLMIAEWFARHADEKPLAILDTLGKVKPPKKAGEESYAADYAIGSKLKTAVDAVQGASLLAVHHTRKASSEDFVDAVSGTQGIAGSADFVLVLTRKRGSDTAILSVTGRDVPENDYAFRTTNCRWTLDGMDLPDAAATAAKRKNSGNLGDRSADAYTFVHGRPDGTRAVDLAGHLGIGTDDAGRYLRRLYEGGRIRKLSRGLYGPLSEVSEVSEREEGTSSEAEPRSTTSDTISGVRNVNSSDQHIHSTSDTSDTSDTVSEKAVSTSESDAPASCTVCGQHLLLPRPGKTVCEIRDDAHNAARAVTAKRGV